MPHSRKVKVKVKEGIFAIIPTDTQGKLYVSPMPYGPYDRFNRLMKIYKRHQVQWAAVLVTPDEIQLKGRKDLFNLYIKAGIRVIHHPLPDLTAPRDGSIRMFINDLALHLETGNLVIHCNAGVGRTGVMTACLVMQLTGCSGEEALSYVQKHMLINMTDAQKRFVRNWTLAPGAQKKRPPGISAPSEQGVESG